MTRTLEPFSLPDPHIALLQTDLAFVWYVTSSVQSLSMSATDEFSSWLMQRLFSIAHHLAFLFMSLELPHPCEAPTFFFFKLVLVFLSATLLSFNLTA